MGQRRALPRDGEQKTYYDGVLQEASSHSGAIGATDRNLLIGYSENCPSQGHFRGMVDEVRIYNRVLSPEEVQWQFESGRQAPKSGSGAPEEGIDTSGARGHPRNGRHVVDGLRVCPRWASSQPQPMPRVS